MKKTVSILSVIILLFSVFFVPVSAQAASLPAPYHVSAIKVSESSARICWPRVNDAKKYKVYRATKRKGSYKLVKTTTGFNFVDKGLKSSVIYYYKIKAVNGKIESGFSPIKAFKLGDMKTGTLTGRYHVIFKKSDISYNSATREYTIKGYTCYPCTVSKAKIKKHKGETFPIKCTHAAKGYYYFKLKANSKGTSAEIVYAKYVDTENNKTYKHDADSFYLQSIGSAYAIRKASNTGVPINDYATHRNVTVYVRADDSIMSFDGFGGEEAPSWSTGNELLAYTEDFNNYNNVLETTVENGYAVYLNTTPEAIG